MECTQRLDFESSHCERICPEQIGFLGILGTKHPVIRGPNKVGRDPQTCSIVLNLNSISRQHAVINVLSGSEYMLMDLDSANKTRLNNKVLPAYIPASLSNGDTVQFGDVFGVFRLLEEDTELPATQAIDLPETPVVSRATKLRQATIPESPDISDRDDSFVVPSQPIPHKHGISPSNKFIKPSSKTISIQPVGSSKIDNVYWNSSKKSSSFNLDDSNSSINKTNNDIHDAETQPPDANESTNSIYSAATQLPDNLPAIRKINNQHEMEIDLFAANKENDISIFNAETQFVLADDVKPKINDNNNIFEANTQMPDLCDRSKNNSDIFTAETQNPDEKDIENRIKDNDNIFEANTQLPPLGITSKSDSNMFTAETQIPGEKDVKNEELTTKPDDNLFEANTQMPSEKEADNYINVEIPNEKFDVHNKIKDNTDNKHDKSDETILFDELDAEGFMDEFQSQPLLPPEFNADIGEDDIPLSQPDTVVDEDEEKDKDSLKSSESDAIRPCNRNIRIESDEEKDKDSIKSSKSDTIRPCKRNIRIESDSSSDCDDIGMLPTQKILSKSNEDDLTDCEDDSFPSEGKRSEKPKESTPELNFEDLATQVIPDAEDVVDSRHADKAVAEAPAKETNFEDMLTQVIPADNGNKDVEFEDLPTQVLENVSKNVVANFKSKKSLDKDSPFKVPLQTPLKAKKKDTPKSSEKSIAPEEKYYAATQEILTDLCSQFEMSPIKAKSEAITSKSAELIGDEKIVPSSVQSLVIGEKQLENESSPKKKYVMDKSFEEDEKDVEDKVTQFVSSLSSKQVSEVIGADVQKPKKVPSDPSDVEVTPKKLRPFNIFHTELPSSQEIKTSVPLSSFTPRQDDSVLLLCGDSQSETENDSQEGTPIVFHKKKRTANVKKDLATKFDVSALPTRVITRTRKPTAKCLESIATNQTKNILKPKFLTEQDDDVDSEMINDNITKLKNKSDKKSKDSKDVVKIEVKKEEGKETKEFAGQKTTTRRKNDKAKKADTTIDLTKVDEVKTEKPARKSAEKISEVEAPTRRARGRPRQNDKAETVIVIEDKQIRKEVKVEEKVARPKSRGPRMDKSKKDNTQGKITDYTIPKINNSKSTSIVTDSSLNSTNVTSLNSTNETSKSTRSSRSRNQSKDSQDQDSQKKSVSPENTKRRRGRPKKDDMKSEDKTKDATRTEKNKIKEKPVTEKNKTKDKPVTEKDDKRRRRKEDSQPKESEVRRSKRQRTVKESNSQNQTTHEQSTVYNISSESNVDSPRSLKRSATEDVAVPSKRSRSVISSVTGSTASSVINSVTSSATSSDVVSISTSEVNSNSSSRRSTPSRGVRPYHVLFTAFPGDDIKTTLENLGAVIVGEPAQCSVAVTIQLRRTVKLLCCVGLGRPVVGVAWLQACKDNNALVDPWQYLLKDEANEQRFHFDLEKTLTGPRNYLRGYSVSATPSVMPSAPEMKRIVECSGGTWKEGGSRWVAVSCRADSALWPLLRARGAIVVSSEFILTGVLKQELLIDTTLLV